MKPMYGGCLSGSNRGRLVVQVVSTEKTLSDVIETYRSTMWQVPLYATSRRLSPCESEECKSHQLKHLPLWRRPLSHKHKCIAVYNPSTLNPVWGVLNIQLVVTPTNCFHHRTSSQRNVGCGLTASHVGGHWGWGLPVSDT